MEPRALRYGSWTGTIAPLVIWMGYFIVVYAAVSIGCIGGFANAYVLGLQAITLVVGVITATALLGIVAFAWIAYRGWRHDRDDDVESERTRFAAVLTLLVALLAVVATAWVALPATMLHPCQ